jgi:hypothetical protein
MKKKQKQKGKKAKKEEDKSDEQSGIDKLCFFFSGTMYG